MAWRTQTLAHAPAAGPCHWTARHEKLADDARQRASQATRDGSGPALKLPLVGLHGAVGPLQVPDRMDCLLGQVTQSVSAAVSFVVFRLSAAATLAVPRPPRMVSAYVKASWRMGQENGSSAWAEHATVRYVRITVTVAGKVMVSSQ